MDAISHSFHLYPRKGAKNCFKYKYKYLESNLFIIA